MGRCSFLGSAQRALGTSGVNGSPHRDDTKKGLKQCRHSFKKAKRAQNETEGAMAACAAASSSLNALARMQQLPAAGI